MLFIVVQEPKRGRRESLAIVIQVLEARSKAHALRLYADKDPAPDAMYRRPTADPVRHGLLIYA